MPNDLVIRPIAVAAQGAIAAHPMRTVLPPPEAAGSTEDLPNPTMRLDPVLGLVVIEFHNGSGSLTSSIPGQRQLDAYRMARELNNPPDPIPGSDPHVHTSATRTV